MTKNRRPVRLHPVAGRHSTLHSVVVAVPARDEADRIGACLRSIDLAAGECSDIRVVVVVAADSCRDATAELAAWSPGTSVRRVVVAGSWQAVGAARAAAVDAGRSIVGDDVDRIWIANTDADCVVPRTWLRTQLQHAREVDAVTGLVRLDPCTTPALRRRFVATYTFAGTDHHHHVHGANLGVRAAAYDAVGGWPREMTLGEDHELWDRLVAGGHPVRQPTDVVVTTSGRTRSRVEGGFATDMALLAADAQRSA